MNISAKTTLSAALFCTIALLTAPAAPPEEKALENRATQLHSKDTVDMNAQAATMFEMIDWVRSKYPACNILVSPELNDTMVDSLKLRSVNLSELLDAIIFASNRPAGWVLSENIYYVFPQPGKPIPDPSKRVLGTFNMKDYFSVFDKGNDPALLESLRTMAVQALADLKGRQNGKIDQPKFQFYPDAKLLIVTGSPEMIDIIGKIIQTVAGQTSAKPPSGTPASP